MTTYRLTLTEAQRAILAEALSTHVAREHQRQVGHDGLVNGPWPRTLQANALREAIATLTPMTPKLTQEAV